MLYSLCDTSGQEEYEQIRQLFYIRTSIALLCFNVKDIASKENIFSFWIPELRQANSHCQVILVANNDGASSCEVQAGVCFNGCVDAVVTGDSANGVGFAELNTTIKDLLAAAINVE